MNQIEFNKLTFCQKVRFRKRNFCNKLINFLDKIITKCADKNDLDVIERRLDTAEEIESFSEKFYENKDNLEYGINELQEKANKYEWMIKELFVLHCEKNYENMDVLFEAQGYKKINKIKGI